MNNIEFRPARTNEGNRIAPLIYRAAPRILDYTFSVKTPPPDDQDVSNHPAIRFIEYCFVNNQGFYAQRFQFVAVIDERIVMVGTVYPADLYHRLVAQAFRATIKSAGVINTAKIIARSAHIQHLFTPPEKNAVFIANLSVIPEMRGKGIATRFIEQVETAQCSSKTTHLCLDVGLDNPGAKRLYERLGFTSYKINCYTGNADIDGVVRMHRNVRGV